jgi:transcriptional regulator with XRE-family HTH domain
MKRFPLSIVLARLMRDHGWTQTALAREFRVSQATISRWSSGDRRPSRRDLRARLLDLGVDPKWL